jgi:hypothetical protein
VDQFEEIFRFRQQGYSSEAEADAFVELLLATVAHREVPIYVLLTMRSDFFGDCALFHDLPEAINNSQFLTPRLTRAQQQVAIEGPASVFGATIAATLVNRLLNDMGPDPDQLPLMQHVLMRMWTRKVATTAEAGEKAAQEAGITLTLDDYAAIGGLSEALSWHADEAFVELDERHQRVAEVLFRCLSERSLERRDTRRPVPVKTVAAVAGVSWRQVAEVVEVFRRPDRSFLTPPVGTALHPETMLDISHESLIRQWRRMTEWVEKEARSAESYRHLEQTARRWRAESDEQRRKDYLWHGHELGLALDWRAQESPTSIWAERYGTAFDLAMAFLDASAQERETRRQQQEAAQRRKFRRALTGLIAIVIAVGIVAVIFAIQRKDAVVAKNEAVKARTKADVQGLLTEARRRPDEFGALLALQGLKMNKDASMQHQLDDALQEILGAAHFSHTLPVSNSEGIRVIAFSPNGRWLAAVMPSFMTPEDATVGVWNLRDIQSGIEKPRMRLPHTGVSALAFSPSGRFLAAGGSQALCLWDFDTLIQSEGDMPPCEALPLPSKHLPLPKGITTASLAFGPDDDKFVLGSREKAVLVWNLHVADKPIQLGEHGSPPQVSSVAFSSDGRWVASGGQDKKELIASKR